MDELKDYASTMPYSFLDVKSEVRRLTNAGLDLKSSVKTVKGIYNMAVTFGLNPWEISDFVDDFAKADSGIQKI